MFDRHRLTYCSARFAIILTLHAPPLANAAMLRFDKPETYQVNQLDTDSAPALIGNSLNITSGDNQTRSVFFKNRLDVTGPFEASFTYRVPNVTALRFGQGLTFTMQNSDVGIDAIGASGSRDFGYEGIGKSIAVALEVYNNPMSIYVGLYNNGEVTPGGATLANPIDARTASKIDVTVGYDGTLLTVTLNDDMNEFGPIGYNVGSIASILGSSDAFIGFTAESDGGFSGSVSQTVSDLEFHTLVIPEPSGVALASVAVAAIANSRRRKRWRSAGRR